MLSAAKKQVSEDDRLQLDPKKHVTAEDLEGVLSDVDTQGLSSVDMVRKMRDE
jgi:hypothetical protein